jgi:hypothetical protein
MGDTFFICLQNKINHRVTGITSVEIRKFPALPLEFQCPVKFYLMGLF